MIPNNINNAEYAIGWPNPCESDDLSIIKLPIVGGMQTKFHNGVNNGLKTRAGLQAILQEGCELQKLYKRDVPVSYAIRVLHKTQPLAHWIHEHEKN